MKRSGRPAHLPQSPRNSASGARGSGAFGKRRRSGINWLVRGSLVLVATAAGLSSLSASLANVTEKADAATAHKLSPQNGRFGAAAVASAFAVAPQQSRTSLQARQALRALAQDGTAVDALTVLALQAQLRGEADAAQTLFRHSTALSRRELQNHLWAIEYAVSRGDIPAAVSGYDRALRSSAKARRDLLPILTSASAEPAIRRQVVETVLKRPVWARAFINQAAERASNPLAAAQLFEELRARDYPITRADRARAVTQLHNAGLYEDAWNYYARLHPNADRKRSRDGLFTLAGTVPTPFDWTISASSNGAAAILPPPGGKAMEQGGAIDFSFAPGVGAEVATQQQWLPAGQYTLTGRSEGIDVAPSSRPYWRLTCQNGEEAGRVTVTNSDENEGRFEGAFTVPAACSRQALTLTVRAVHGSTGANGQIVEARLEPLR